VKNSCNYLSESPLLGDMPRPEHKRLKGPVPSGESVGELEGIRPTPGK